MKSKVNERTIIFTKDYVNKQAGTVLTCDVVMASHLMQVGVAEIHTPTIIKEIEIKPIIKKLKKK